MVRSASLLLAFVGFATAVACTRGEEEELVDEGQACVSGVANEAHQVEVDAGTCLSGSCDELVEAMCTARLEGSTLTVSSDFTVLRNTKNQCTLDCQPATTTCETPPLPEGEYTLVYGDEEVALTVPAAMSTCAGSA